MASAKNSGAKNVENFRHTAQNLIVNRDAYIVPAAIFSEVLEVVHQVPPLEEILEELVAIQDALPEEKRHPTLSDAEKIQKAALLEAIRRKEKEKTAPQ